MEGAEFGGQRTVTTEQSSAGSPPPWDVEYESGWGGAGDRHIGKAYEFQKRRKVFLQIKANQNHSNQLGQAAQQGAP